MTLARLCAALEAVGIAPTVEDVLDVLWLAGLHRPVGDVAVAPVAERTTEPVAVPAEPPAVAPEPVRDVPPLPPPRPPDPEPTVFEATSDLAERVEAHLPRRGRAREPVGARSVRVPGVRALTGSLGLARSLRGLKRRHMSTSRWEVDEAATVDRIAEEEVWQPVIRPSAERWLDLALIVDDSASMVIWWQLVAEFRDTLAHSGAFADVRVWRLGLDEQGDPMLRATSSASSGRRPRELVDARGRRAFLVVSDCLSAAWREDRMRPVLADLGSTGPLALIQPLPQRLWQRTGLSVRAARLRIHRPAQPNSDIEVDPAVDGAIPVLELTREWLASWSTLVAGRHAWTDLAVAVPPNGVSAPPVPVTEARDRVLLFKQSASAAAYHLACHLSAAPLSLPIMRLVQRVRIPGSRPAHLAEVFLGGLIERHTPSDEVVHPDNIEYDFVPGVREVLLDTVTRVSAFGVLNDVAMLLSRSTSRPLDFPALLADPEGPSFDALDRFSRPFAKVARAVITKFGGIAAPVTADEQRQLGDGLGRRPVVRTLRKVQLTRPRRFALSSRQTGNVMAPRRTLRPMIFVGLGGEGGRIGAEVERALREEFCGANGTKLINALPGHDLQPFELPSFFQFVYADFDEDDLVRQRAHAGIDGERNSIALNRNVHRTRALFPRINSYPELARQLRITLPEVVAGWLPPAVGEPMVAPLTQGAGGLPTVGRAALFDALRFGINPVIAPINSAIGTIANSAGQLSRLGGRLGGSCDVFVAFSAAGGTGAGVFYDYLHLIDEVLASASFRAQIFPVVVLPPAGSPTAVLNTGGVLVDLFRLVDEQAELMNVTALGTRPATTRPQVLHPGVTQSRLRPASMQSVFLFGGAPGMDSADVRHNAAALPLLMSVYGTAEEETSFADTFVRAATGRGMPAPDGIGGRIASSLAIASLTVPVDDLAALAADRLLAESIADLLSSGTEDLDDAVARLFADAEIAELYEMPTREYPKPNMSGTSVSATQRYFGETTTAMSAALSAMRDDLARSVPAIASRFDPARAIRAAIDSGDLFQTWQAFNGIPSSSSEVGQLGFVALVRSRRGEPPRPDGVELAPPPMPVFRATGVFRRGVPNSEVTAAAAEQNRWYAWRSAREWHLAWGRETQRWARKLDEAGAGLRAVVYAFTDHAYLARQRFDRRSGELRQHRGATTYLLPNDGDLDAFYVSVLARLHDVTGTGHATGAADIIRGLLGPDVWTIAYDVGLNKDAQASVDVVLGRLRDRIRDLFQWTTPGHDPLLPKLSDTLSDHSAELVRFCAALPGLMPVDLTEDSHTSVRLQLFYPAPERNPWLEDFVLENAVPKGAAWSAVEMHPVPVENLTAMVFGTGIGLTQVPDARAAVRAARAAVGAERSDDLMRWRHRLGPDDGHLTTGSRHAIILRGMLTEMWNGRAEVVGRVDDPETVTFRLNELSPITLELGGHRVKQFSSWGWLIHAYENWALEINSPKDWAASDLLLRSLPRYFRLAGDATVFTGIMSARRSQSMRASNALAGGDRGHWAQTLLRFWTGTFSAALDAHFGLHRETDDINLRDLIDNEI